MSKTLAVLAVSVLFSFFVGSVIAQTTTMSPTPTPTSTSLPSGAPQTGFGQ